MAWLSRSSASKRAAFPDGVISAADAARTYPTGHAYRAQAIALRIVTAIALLLAAGNVAQALAIAKLVPSLRLVPLFLTTEPEQRTVVRIQPAVRDGTIVEQLEHGWVREYVIKAESVVPDPRVMTPVVQPGSGWIARRSTTEVYAAYRAGNEQYIRQALGERISRTVELDDPVRLPQAGRVYQVDFVAVEATADGREIGRRSLRAVLAVEYRATEASLAEYRGGNLDNPIGFFVTSYNRSGRAEGR